MPKVYSRALFEVPEVDEGTLVATLGEDSLGVREIARGAGRVVLELWFEQSAEDLESGLAGGLYAPREVTELQEQDWMAGARARAEPVAVGKTFLLDPREPDDEAPAEEKIGSRTCLRLPARRAFGTGTHETTQLMVEGLEALDVSGCRVLDVGSGTGVLAFVALCRGAASVLGFDLDLPSAFVSRENFDLNRTVAGSVPTVFAGSIESVGAHATFDLVLVNVLPEHLRGSERRIAGAVGPAGRLLLAGLLHGQREDVLGRWIPHGLAPAGEWSLGEWLLVELRRGPAGAEEPR